ncbi:MAG: hypothetical protein WD397_04415 [Wenzhouxiangellaceae bacterium]
MNVLVNSTPNVVSPPVLVPMLGAQLFKIELQLQIQTHFASRCALAGELLFSVAKKVTKNALYRQQKMEMRVDRQGGLVFDRGTDPGSFCTFGVFLFGSVAVSRFRLRW